MARLLARCLVLEAVIGKPSGGSHWPAQRRQSSTRPAEAVIGSPLRGSHWLIPLWQSSARHAEAVVGSPHIGSHPGAGICPPRGCWHRLSARRRHRLAVLRQPSACRASAVHRLSAHPAALAPLLAQLRRRLGSPSCCSAAKSTLSMGPLSQLCFWWDCRNQ